MERNKLYKIFKKPLSSLWAAIGLLAVLILQQTATTSAANITSAASGNWNNPSTWSGGSVPTASDNVTVQHQVLINTNGYCANLNVSAAALQFATSSGRSYTLKVTGNVTVATRIEYASTTTGSYTFEVGGNITNLGQIILFVTNSDNARLVFTGSTDSRINNFGTWNLGEVILSKTGRNNTLDVLSSGFESGLRSLTVQKGTYIHDNSGLFNIPAPANYTIGPQAIFHVPAGTLGFSTAGDSLTLQGELHVTGGTVNVGNTTGTGGIVYDRADTSVTPFLNITSGGIQVKGGVTYGFYSAGEPFRFSMFGGFLLLNGGSVGTRRQVFCVSDASRSNFTMNGGNITLVKPNSAAGNSVSDFSVCGMNGTVNVTGGTVQFGQMSTLIPKPFTFSPFYNGSNTSFTLPHIVVAAPYPSGGATLAPVTGNTSNFNVLSLQVCVAAKFDMRAVSGSITGDGRIMSIKGANSGVAFANSGIFLERTSTVRFFPPNGAVVPQRITGSNGASIGFYRLDIANPNHVTLQYPVKVSNFVSLTSGRLNTTSLNILICQSNATTSSGNTTAYVNGPMIHTVAATSATKFYPIGKDAAFRPVEIQLNHADNNAVTYEGEVFNIPANTLPPCLPSSIASVSNVRYTKFTRMGTSRFLSGSITMHYGPDDGVSDLNSLIIAQESYPNPSCWMNLGQDITGTGSLVSGWIRSDIAQFNPVQTGSTYFTTDFSLANPPGGGNYLPVSLVDFDAIAVGNTVSLKWTTESETNCDHFTLERSTNLQEFTAIGTLAGNGNSSVRHEYSYSDDQPVRGVSYYRLLQSDFDGTTVTYGPVAVRFSKADFSLYPNPTDGQNIRLKLEGGDIGRYSVKIYDTIGREVPFLLDDSENGSFRLRLMNRQEGQAAFYLITATDGIDVYQERLVVE
jgi:hypothetical protein